ncbi:MAG: endonuclease [Verrucomicrobiales bacterium]|nr:endonuclease [Verrucomicrobiales bacterium]
MQKRVLAPCLALLLIFFSTSSRAQVLFSSGNYSQNFNSLASSGTANSWTDNVTLPGWYASKTVAPNNVTNYNAGTGSSSTGALYSYGSTSASERALGSLGSSGPGDLAYGIRFTNDAVSTAQSNLTISYTGEQWRNGGNINAHRLAFSYRIGNGLTNADALNAQAWKAFTNLDFISPIVGASSATLDGNNALNQVTFSSVVISGEAVLPGQELFLRWFDNDDTGSDHGLAIDNLTVSFSTVSVDIRPASIATPPEDQVATQGGNATFSVVADGASPLNYQWQFNGTNLSSATLSSLILTNVNGNSAGTYFVIVSNAYGSTNASALLTVSAPTSGSSNGLSLMTYNVKGNGATNWTTNAPQVQAIGRQVMYVQPDVITFNEIPNDLWYEMTNFVKAFLPSYALAINSGTDGFIRSAIVSRHPITRASKWMDGADLNPFGYTNANFTRDLFEAQITVPSFSRPLHVFTTHLKSSSGGYTDAAAKRAAEAAAITNFFATNLFVLYPNDPYTLSGDMNESDTNTLVIQRLVSAASGLHLTNPRNPFTSSINTYSIQASVSERIDYIMPCTLLASNILSSQVFRTDLLNPMPANLQTNDDKTASDHLPVLMYFSNPYDVPYRIGSATLTNQLVTLNWESINGRQYRVDASADLANWIAIRTNTAASTNFSFTTNATSAAQFYRIYRIP